LNRLSALEPKPPPQRFEVEAPGALLYLDTKKLARFIRNLLNDWAYAHAYPSSEAWDAYLPHRLHYYNGHRPDSRLGNQVPVSRFGPGVNSVVRLHS